GKQTVYRWWPGKADVLLEALGLKADLYIPAPDLGDFEADLRAFLEATFTLARDPRIVAVLRSLMAEAQVDQGFGERFRSSFLQSRRDALAQIMERAGTRGDLPGNVTPETVIDLVFGILWYRLLADHRPLDDRLVDELLRLLGHSRQAS
ncbi:MAG: hypothetical protein QOH03_8, partial [Kribbellaceae bacterium]|nr:hypothetical protein [Kribbellaceae bacterium]